MFFDGGRGNTNTVAYRMSSQRLALGKKGEKLARKYLQKKGYRILVDNYRTPRGEIDIIAEQGGAIVFIEVKTRSDMTFGCGLEAVTTAKQKQISMVALEYLASQGFAEAPARFDVVAVSDKGGNKPEILLVVNAFDLQFGD